MDNQFWKDYGFVARGKLRRRVLSIIDKPKTPLRLAREANIHLAEASRVLIELTKHGLAQCITPNYKSGRVYKLTPRGEKVKRELINEDKLNH
jgi:predicted transcriptional regulator